MGSGWKWLLLVVCGGCAQTATFRQLEPGRVDISGQTVAVMPIECQRSEAEHATEQLIEQLRSSGAVTVITQRQLEGHATAPLIFANGAVNRLTATPAARRAGVQVLLLSKIRFFESDGSPYGTVKMRVGDPKVAAICQYQLIDPYNGSVLDEGRVQSNFIKGEYSIDPAELESEARLLKQGVEKCVVALTDDLVPHLSEVRLTLARRWLGDGAGAIRAGNRAARRGDWNLALQHFQSAAEEEVTSDSAWYSVGLALEATGRLQPAQAAYQQAQGLKNESLYAEALARVEAAQPSIALAQRQKMQAVSMHPRSNPMLAGATAGALDPSRAVHRFPPLWKSEPELSRPPTPQESWLQLKPRGTDGAFLAWPQEFEAASAAELSRAARASEFSPY